MRLEALNKIFPHNPELVAELWTPGAEQMGSADIAENVFKRKDTEKFGIVTCSSTAFQSLLALGSYRCNSIR